MNPVAPSSGKPLVAIETHPIQYRAPVYRALRQKYGVPITVIYGSDFSVAGYYDPEFRTQFAWDTDLLSGYEHLFLSTVAQGGGRTYETVSTRGLARALRTLAPGAVLLPGYSPRFHQLAWLQAWLTGRPILFRGETADRPQSSGTIQLQARDRMLGLLYSKCSRLLYIGRRSREHFVLHGCPEEKLVFSPYCVDPGPFQVDENSRSALRSHARAEMGIGHDDRVLLFSGKLSERKGPDLIIEAVRTFPAEERSRTVIVFLGDGEMKPVLEAAAERLPQLGVRFPGFRNQREMSGYFHAADLFVLPSRRNETWGLVVNEALQHGLPCVVSDAVGCGPDLAVQGTGEVFASGSSEALAEAIQKAFGLAGREEIRDACRRKIASYSVDKAAEGIARAYEASIA
ncbi:MAG TPA: glycosyltransferase family 4 protein [Bryobacteraceae bacterium]|jgi:glycosyltransferase involved in cell wall biosynthesis|nr:glycosyltransferase family 4 protein [Bryobacteraceae bacterium]